MLIVPNMDQRRKSVFFFIFPINMKILKYVFFYFLFSITYIFFTKKEKIMR